MIYVIWDWNGTLLDDTMVAVDALNEMLARRSLSPITLDFYRNNFAFPVRPFYEAIGVNLANENWDSLAREYHETYRRQKGATLSDGAREALEAIRGKGIGQSLVSALEHGRLVCDVERFGIAGFFDSICGTDNLDGASKLDLAKGLAARLRERCGDGLDIVLVGDALHDKETADAIGARCVLFSGGSHSASRLKAVAPTVGDFSALVGLIAKEDGDR